MALPISKSLRSANGSLSPGVQAGSAAPTLSATRERSLDQSQVSAPSEEKGLKLQSLRAVLALQALLTCRLPFRWTALEAQRPCLRNPYPAA